MAHIPGYLTAVEVRQLEMCQYPSLLVEVRFAIFCVVHPVHLMSVVHELVMTPIESAYRMSLYLTKTTTSDQ